MEERVKIFYTGIADSRSPGEAFDKLSKEINSFLSTEKGILVDIKPILFTVYDTYVTLMVIYKQKAASLDANLT